MASNAHITGFITHCQSVPHQDVCAADNHQSLLSSETCVGYSSAGVTKALRGSAAFLTPLIRYSQTLTPKSQSQVVENKCCRANKKVRKEESISLTQQRWPKFEGQERYLGRSTWKDPPQTSKSQAKKAARDLTRTPGQFPHFLSIKASRFRHNLQHNTPSISSHLELGLTYGLLVCYLV